MIKMKEDQYVSYDWTLRLNYIQPDGHNNASQLTQRSVVFIFSKFDPDHYDYGYTIKSDMLGKDAIKSDMLGKDDMQSGAIIMKPHD